jgi:N-acetylglucosaminyldiphosphoundecaprenol N-acetyl-beta-D-mannosaminyltransferase
MVRFFGINGADALNPRGGNYRFYGSAESDDLHMTALIFGLPLACTYSLRHAEGMVRNYVSHRPTAPVLVTFANPLAVKLVGSDPAYHANIHRMDLVFCDGIALAWAARWIARYPMERISFDSTGIAPSVFGIAQERGRTIAIVGGRPGVAEAAGVRIQTMFPRLRIVAATDGFRPVGDLIRTIMDLDPDIVVCGMGAPRQERFLVALANAGWRGTGFTCGGYLDHLVDRFDFYPAIINRLNLRWLYRLAREPGRIGYRIVVEYAPFWRAAGRELLCGVMPLQRRGRRS